MISAKLIGVKLFTKTAIIEMMLTKILDHHAHLTKKKKKKEQIFHLKSWKNQQIKYLI